MNNMRLKILIAGAVGLTVLTGGAIYAFHSEGSPKVEQVSVDASSPTPVHDLGKVDTVLPTEVKSDEVSKDKKEPAKQETNKTNEKKEETKNAVKEEKKSTDTAKPNKTEKKENKKTETKSVTHKGQAIAKAEKGKASKSVTQNDWVAKLNVAKQCSQLITVQASGKTARVQFHVKGSDGKWKQEFSTNGYVGYNGITSNKREGDGRTPVGVYSLGTAFGISGNPGTNLGYRHINGNDYWVDDVHSSHYNEWVNTSSCKKDWKSAEHMISQPVAYKYGIVVNYNTSRTAGRGSGIFIHCSKGGGTAGCVAIPESDMIRLLRSVNDNARIVISSYDGIYNY